MSNLIKNLLINWLLLPKLLNVERVLVGYDTRLSSLEIFESLTRGILDCGCDVYDMGLSTTPMVYYATATHGFGASIQITASHNGKEYNGFKISRDKAMPVGGDTGLMTLKSMIENDEIVVSPQRGSLKNFNIKDEYINYQKSKIKDIRDLKISIDCSNGMSVVVIKDILGSGINYINDDLNGNFPNHEPNPLIEKNCEQLEKLVVDTNSDIGIIFDGDADRAVFVDEKGRFISPDLIIALIARTLLKDNKGYVVYDIRSSNSVPLYITQMGGTPYMWKVGHAFAKLKLRELDAIYGGELAGHYYFKDFFYCDSAILAAIHVLNVVNDLKKNNVTLSQFIDSITKYFYSGEINFTVIDKDTATESIVKYFTLEENPVNIYDFDGVRMEFKNWWFNVRQSNTEAYLRIVVEADNKDVLDQKVDLIKKILEKA